MPVKKSSAEKVQELIKVFDIQHVPAYLNSSPINLPKNVVPLQDTSSHHTARNKLILSSNSVQPTKMPNHPVYTLRSRSFHSSPRSPQLHLYRIIIVYMSSRYPVPSPNFS
ncbi:hypothetical protein HZ326_15382 [Fusarium oxysporum f. sp. albedinis]|nr:hypothetical protein HZ326_15382 [Fusarium oxysporum f. sp. albedinis]